MRTLLTYCASAAVLDRYHTARAAQLEFPELPVDVHLDVSNANGAGYNLSAARNRCIEHAIHGGYDLLLLCDADTVIESLTVSELMPDYGKAVVRDYAGNPDYQPCSWLALRRSVFAAKRYEEAFDSIFWQDIDFDQNVCRGIPKIPLWHEMRCRHIEHPPATQCPNVLERAAAGEALFNLRHSTGI
jgi:hypothetical protein